MNKEPKKDKINEKWTPEQEGLLAEWAEKASGYRWLHSRSEKLYRKRNYTFTIPVIILSTLTGTANFAMDSFVPEENKQVAMACVGGVNIFAGILSTLQNFLRYAELMEGHRVSEVSWSKFNREISVELALNPQMRKPAGDFLNVSRAEYDRLIEQSPTIDDSIIAQYKAKFGKEKINHPHVCNGLHKCRIYEPDKDEKKAAILANAGEKLKKSTIHHVKKNLQQAVKQETQTVKYSYEQKNENLKELDNLKGFGKVSGLKQKINPEKTYQNHQEELKTLIPTTDSHKESVKEISEKNEEKTEVVDEENLPGKDEPSTKEIMGDSQSVKDVKSLVHSEEVSENQVFKGEKKNIKVSIDIDDNSLKEGEYELFKGSLNKKDKKIGGDIFLVEKKEGDTVDEEVKDVVEDIIIDIGSEEKEEGEKGEGEKEEDEGISDFLDGIK